MFDIYNGKIMVFFTIKHYIFGLTYPRYRLKNGSLFTLILPLPNLVINESKELNLFLT